MLRLPDDFWEVYDRLREDYKGGIPDMEPKDVLEHWGRLSIRYGEHALGGFKEMNDAEAS